MDAGGHAFVTGRTGSTDFPIVGGVQTQRRGLADVFVTKFYGDGSALVYSTYLGGNQTEVGKGITVDATGNAYLTGQTFSSDFPTLNAAQPNFGGNSDAFITKLNPTGSALIFSTFLGGSGNENSNGGKIVIDATANIYVTGETASANFPTTLGALQTTYGGGFSDAFAAKLNSTGSSLIYSTFLGGTGQDRGQGIALNQAGNAYITGITDSLNFHVHNAFQPQHGGGQFDAFVAKIVDITPTKQKRNNLEVENPK